MQIVLWAEARAEKRIGPLYYPVPPPHNNAISEDCPACVSELDMFWHTGMQIRTEFSEKMFTETAR